MRLAVSSFSQIFIDLNTVILTSISSFPQVIFRFLSYISFCRQIKSTNNVHENDYRIKYKNIKVKKWFKKSLAFKERKEHEHKYYTSKYFEISLNFFLVLKVSIISNFGKLFLCVTKNVSYVFVNLHIHLGCWQKWGFYFIT